VLDGKTRALCTVAMKTALDRFDEAEDGESRS
jgi:hypothetical protein